MRDSVQVEMPVWVFLAAGISTVVFLFWMAWMFLDLSFRAAAIAQFCESLT